MSSVIRLIDFEASSLAGITKSITVGSEFVSTIPITGIFSLRASLTAMYSFETSTIKSAAGSRVKSLIEPRSFSSFALWRLTCRRSRFDMLANVPSVAILSIVAIFLMALRTVGKLVSIPPDQRSVTYGIPVAFTLSDTISFACFFVATNRIFLPDFAMLCRASAASSTFATVLWRSMMWMPLRSMKMYGAIFGFHLRLRCPKWTPASSNSVKVVLGIMLVYLLFWQPASSPNKESCKFRS